MPSAKCPVCDNEIELGEEPKPNISVKCPYCGSILITYRTKHRWILRLRNR